MDVFCPPGSHKPTNVTEGHYTVGGDIRNTTRVYEVLCEKGSYCTDGVKRACAAGVWGGEEGMVGKKCSGVCPAGFMCPVGSTEPVECPAGTYSMAGAWDCISCGLDSVAGGQGGSQGEGRCRDSRKCCSQ